MTGSGEILPFSRKRAQIALEFMIVYSFVLVIFMILFVIVVNQRALTLNQQEYSSLQLIAQNIANYINQALSSGNGYNATVLIPGEIGTAPYAIKISSSGVVITNLTVGKESVVAYAFSRARNLDINGTIIASSNGVTIYKIKNIGQVSIANSHGTIYVDKNPISTLSLEGSMAVNPLSSSKAIEFNGQSSIINLAFPIDNLSLHNICNLTLVAWSYDSGMPSTGNEGGVIGLYNGTQPSGPTSGGWADIEYNDNNLRFELRNGTSGNAWGASGTFAKGWMMTAMVLSNGIAEAGYINNQTFADNKNIGCISLNAGHIGAWDRYFNGSIADVQVYNTALSSKQIMDLYNSGIDSYPVMPSNVVLWMPLNGNTKEYARNGNEAPSNLEGSTTVSQLVAKAALANGNAAKDLLIGIIAGNGTFSQSGRSNVALLTNSSGYTNTFLTGANRSSTAVDSYAFNGNQSTVANIVGWWPLLASASAVSNTIYDLSARYDNGNSSNIVWSNYSSASTNFMTAQFDGSSSKIDGSNLYAYPISALAWVYPTNTAKTTDLDTIMEFDGQSADAGTYQFFLVNKGSSYCGGVAGTLYLWNPSGGFCTSLVVPTNKWSLVGFSSNATAQTVYLNTQFQSATTAYQPGSANTMYVIGDQSGTRYFEGNISNVQLYSGIIPSSQVAQVYGEGVNGVPPTSTSALLAWWPFAGDMNSYASSPANITPTNVIFVNNNYVNNYASGSEVASFNGVNGYVDLNNPTYLQFAPGTTYTLGAWIKVNSCTDGAIFGHGASSYTFYIYPSGSSCYLDFASSTVANIGAGVQIPTNQWIYVDAVNNIGTNVYLYVNGQQYGPYTFTNSYSYSEDLRIGDSQSDPGFFFNGQIANAQIYNIGLTPTQIAQLYQQGPPQIAYKNLTFG